MTKTNQFHTAIDKKIIGCQLRYEINIDYYNQLVMVINEMIDKILFYRFWILYIR
ncbi:MAG: hypothetical protein ACLTFB_02515 [Candidatus Phytoplasma pyri]|uniref:hypothetical protein n=1 Tax=Candidatus Phytoplasma pyri TaxID=47566 RepID=UPI0039837BC1